MGLTRRCASLVDAVVAAGLSRQQQLLAHLTPAEQEQLSGLLRQVLAPLEAGAGVRVER